MKRTYLLVGLLMMACLGPQAAVAEEWEESINGIIIWFANENEKAFPNEPMPPPPGYGLTKASSCIYPEIAALNQQYELIGGRQLWRSVGAAVRNVYYLVFPDTFQIEDIIEDYAKAEVTAGVVANAPLEFLGQPIAISPNDFWYNYTFPYDDHGDCDTDGSHYRQWTLPATRYDRAWAISQGDSTVIVAVMDTGLDRLHPEIANNLWKNQVELFGTTSVDDDGNGYVDDVFGYDFAEQDANVLHDEHWWQAYGCSGPDDPDPDCRCCRAWRERLSPEQRLVACDGNPIAPPDCPYLGGWGSDRHGTVMSSIISAETDNATDPPHAGDIAAITSRVKILTLKVGSRTRTWEADVTGNLADAIESLNYLYDLRVNHGVNVRVLNMSVTMDGHGDLGSTAPKGVYPILADLRAEGVLPVGGAGNWYGEHPDHTVYPCRDPSVLCTACLRETGHKLPSAQCGVDSIRYDSHNRPYRGVDVCGFGTTADMFDILRPRNPGDPPAPVMVLGWEPWNHPDWSFCYNGFPAGPGDFFQTEGQWHIAGITPMLTSGSTAQASGLAALVASVHPEYTADQIEAAIRRGAVSVDALNPSIAGMLGAGRMDAYRTLTLWGTITEDLTLSGQVWISGDVTIPAGRTVTIAPGTLVRVAPDNELQAGTQNAVHVYGTLQAAGTSSEPVVFRSWALNRARGDWLGLRVYPGGSASLDHCTIMHAQTGIVATGPTVLQNCVIDSCAYGVVGAGTAVTLGPLVSIRNTSADAVWMQAGTLTLQGLMVLGSGANGVNAAAGTVLVFGSGMNTIQDCATNGFLLTDITAPVTMQGLFIGGCGTAGVRVVGATGAISGTPQFGSTGLAAIYCDGASPALVNLTTSAPGTVVYAANGANPSLRACSISDCAYALLADPLSRADAGGYQDYGHNHFDRCTMYAATLNQEWPLLMVGNCWEGGVNPRSTKFGPGQIIYLPASCQ